MRASGWRTPAPSGTRGLPSESEESRRQEKPPWWAPRFLLRRNDARAAHCCSAGDEGSAKDVGGVEGGAALNLRVGSADGKRLFDGMGSRDRGHDRAFVEALRHRLHGRGQAYADHAFEL